MMKTRNTKKKATRTVTITPTEYAEEEEPWEEVDEYWYEDAEEWEEPVDYAYYIEAPAPVAGVETYDDVYVNY